MPLSPSDPARRTSAPPKGRPGRRWLALGLSAVLFAGGWLLGRSGCGAAPAPATLDAATTAAVEATATVELRLDAGGLTLMPEGGLELKPLRPVGPAATALQSATGAAGSAGTRP